MLPVDSQDSTTAAPSRPTYIGIHSRDDSTQILYVSSGVRQATGFTPAQVMTSTAVDYIADSCNKDYPEIYKDKGTGNMSNVDRDGDNDDANAYVTYLNVKTITGTPVFQRVTTFKCDSCVIFISMSFPEIPYESKHELKVQMLDGAMRHMNITRDQREKKDNRRIQQHRRLAAERGYDTPHCVGRSNQVKAAFVLEHPNVVAMESEESGRRPSGPLTVFVTGSISHLIEADTGDVMQYPFLKLVAPEDVAHVGRFFERMTESTDVLFETFALIKHPHIIEGDIFVHDEDNPRVVVECLGAAADDGIALMLRRLREVSAPQRDELGNYIHNSKYDVDSNSRQSPSLFEMISSDPETTDAPGWSLH
ncbi:hypothetical protein H4R20_001309 [Coemansia guatemalensis]|uniref:PAS domain-containing protein n=1 Tax=Coemansia guatemalensis TaxID=2761395 RepID=A0A9W8HX97_9FUNG|nr:hypothetical protein H4R20_001309 [Coemansia guatemalensis]